MGSVSPSFVVDEAADGTPGVVDDDVGVAGFDVLFCFFYLF